MKFILIALLFFSVFIQLQARSLQDIKKSGKILISTNGTFAPFSFYQDNKLAGFEVDLATELARDIGLSVEWKIVPFDSSLIGLKQDHYDFVIVSHGITAERAKVVDFTEPYYCTGAVILSVEGGPQKQVDLKGKNIGTQVGTTYHAHLKKIEGIGSIKTYKSETDTLMALIGGRVSAMIGDKFAALATSKSRPEAKLQVGELLFQERIGMAVQKNNRELLAALNTSLKKLLSNGIYKKISEKYFGEDIRCM